MNTVEKQGIKLACGFDHIVDEHFPSGSSVPVDVVATACVSLLGTYLLSVKRVDQISVVSEFVDELLKFLNEHANADLIH
jgi:hypothetical protein